MNGLLRRLGLTLAVDSPRRAVTLDSVLTGLTTDVYGDIESCDYRAGASAVQAVQTSAQDQASVVGVASKAGRYGRLNGDVLECVALVGPQVRALNKRSKSRRVAGCERVTPCYRDVGDGLDVVLGEQSEVEGAVRCEDGRSLDADNARRSGRESSKSSCEAGKTHGDDCRLAI